MFFVSIKFLNFYLVPNNITQMLSIVWATRPFNILMPTT